MRNKGIPDTKKKNILKNVTTDLGKNAEHRRFQERKLLNKKTYSTKKAKYNCISGTKSEKKHLEKSPKKVFLKSVTTDR